MTGKNKTSKGFSDAERAAMQERAKEIMANETGGESAVLAKIAQMPEPDHTMAKRVHAIVKANAPTLSPKTWYGMPAYANGEGKVVCYFRPGFKFKERYAQLGFNDTAKLDEDVMWPIVFALKKLTNSEEKKIAALVKKAVS
ncbi:MAG TPA: hypothetical protein VLE91_00015 [Candidatus Saccharimonadales bacterium]|nr:hypothetical protein [Candidatus Saccharimonadales bacterium]